MITIDYQTGLPFYEQIAERFQTLILRGVLSSDTQMPSVRSLAMELSINPNTIQKAYSLLEQQGYIYPVRGRGNFVADCTELAKRKKEALLEEIRRLLESGRDLGLTRTDFITVVDRLYGEEDTTDDRAERP